MKIYTKTGDGGETGLYGGSRVAKDSARVEAYGAVDELNSVLGVARAALSLPMERDTDGVDALLARIQSELFDLGAELATPPVRLDTALGARVPLATATRVERLEQEIDRFEEMLPPLKTFILPGGAAASATLHQARTVCRRAERRTVSLAHTEEGTVRPEALCYLNRLSDLLFVLARYANHAAGLPDVPWTAGES